MCVFKNHVFIYFLRPPSWSGTLPIPCLLTWWQNFQVGQRSFCGSSCSSWLSRIQILDQNKGISLFMPYRRLFRDNETLALSSCNLDESCHPIQSAFLALQIVITVTNRPHCFRDRCRVMLYFIGTKANFIHSLTSFYICTGLCGEYLEDSILQL